MPRPLDHIPENTKIKGKKYVYGFRARGYQKFEALRFQENRHRNVVNVLTLYTGRLYPC
jgi:hypothetical protein